jgi:hypothetical protein
VNPIRRAGVIAFIDWLSHSHPEITSLCDMDKDEFLSLATEYEASKGLMIDRSNVVYGKWASTYRVFSRALSDNEALQSLR